MKKIVVVGGGTMGLDIAHTFARSGHAVVVREISDELAEKSHSRLVAALISWWPEARWTRPRGPRSWAT